MDKDAAATSVIIGEIAGVSGLDGSLKIRSFMRPPEDILKLKTWCLGPGDASAGARQKSDARSSWVRSDWIPGDAVVRYQVVRGRKQGRHLLARLEGVEDRTKAEALIGQTIRAERDALPEAAPDEYFWDDLIGLEVTDVGGRALGRVSHLLETGANDVLVVREPDDDRERLIPWIPDVVVEVDLVGGRLSVDWDADF